MTRSLLTLAGICLIAAAWPIGYGALVFSGGGHGSPFDATDHWGEWMFGAACVAIPLIIIALGIACLAATTRRRLWTVGAIACALPLDVIFGAVMIKIAMNAYAEPDVLPVQISPEAMLSAPVEVVGGPQAVSVACSSMTGECVSRTVDMTDARPAGQPPQPPAQPPLRPR